VPDRQATGIVGVGVHAARRSGRLFLSLEQDRVRQHAITEDALISRTAGAETKVEYLKNPEASAATTRGGWLRSGDMCHRDADGWLFFDFRKGTEIRHNGEFIQPDFVQKVLAELPEVDDVYVYGIPAKSGAPGEKDVVAALVLVAGATFDPGQFFKACGAQLERNQIPSYVQVLREIPKTASEKPQDRYLIDDLKQQRNPVYEFEDFGQP
jgi:carnitine-CoA ligase